MSPTRFITRLTLGATLLALSANAQTTRPWPKHPPEFDETIITGAVTDEETGEPVAKFTVVPGHGTARDYRLMQRQAQPCVDGEFEFEFDRRPDKASGYHAILIRIEAEGYAPQVIELPPDQQQVKLDITLKKAQNITGKVVTPGEQPADGAFVLIGIKAAGIRLENDEPSESSPGPQATADADGRFMLPPTDGEFRLVAIHESGYGDVLSKDFVQDKGVRLQPWGRVEGVVIEAAEPVPGAIVVLRDEIEVRPDGRPNVVREFSTTADRQGRFVFERVAPGEVMIARRVDVYWGSDMPFAGFTSVDQINVPAGQTLHCQVGGRGRPVCGQVPLPPGAKDEWVCFGAHLMPISPETKRTGPPRYTAELDVHGHFSFTDVEPGYYRLHVQFHEWPPQDERMGIPKVTGIAAMDVTIDQIPGGRSDEALDLGEIELKAPSP